MKKLIIIALLLSTFEVYSTVANDPNTWTSKDVFSTSLAANNFDRGAQDEEEIAFYLTHGDSYLAAPGCGRILINKNKDVQTALKDGYKISKIALVEGIGQQCSFVGVSILSKMDFIRAELLKSNQDSKQIWVGACQVNESRSIWKTSTLSCKK